MNSTTTVAEDDNMESQVSCGASVDADSGIMHLLGPVTCESVAPLIRYVTSVSADPAGRGRLQLYINSDGGSFEDGFALVDVLLSASLPVDTYCIGRVCSVALPVYLTGCTRLVGRHSYAMFHGVSVDGVAGVADSIKKAAREAAHSNKMMMEFICSRTSLSPAALKRAVASGQDYYLYPEEMLKKGIATGYL